MQQRISCPTKNQEVKNDSAERLNPPPKKNILLKVMFFNPTPQDLALHWMEDEKTEEKKQNGKGNGWIV